MVAVSFLILKRLEPTGMRDTKTIGVENTLKIRERSTQGYV